MKFQSASNALPVTSKYFKWTGTAVRTPDQTRKFARMLPAITSGTIKGFYIIFIEFQVVDKQDTFLI